MDEIEWVDPKDFGLNGPSRLNSGGLAWRRKFLELMEKQGVWAVIWKKKATVHDDHRNAAYHTFSNIKRNKDSWVPQGSWELASRAIRGEDNEILGSQLFARYVGPAYTVIIRSMKS